MDLGKRYEEAYEKLLCVGEERRKRKAGTAMGCTSNLDLLCEFDTERLNRLLESHLQGEKLADMKTVPLIQNIQELLRTIVYYCVRGIGGEADVSNVELVKMCFNCQEGMGGTAVQAALALAGLECDSVVHLTDDSKEVCRLLESPFVYTVSGEGEVVHTDHIKQTQEQEVHCIIQFQKGSMIRLGEEQIEIPCSNRLILTKITVNASVPLSKAYLKWVEEHAAYIKSNVISSLNAILEQEVLRQRLRELEEHIRRYRENNPEGIVFFEDAHYHDDAVRKLCLETLYSFVDIVSLNEEELKYTLEEMYGFHVDIEDIQSCIEGAEFIRKKFGIQKGVIVHTKDYSMYVGEKLKADIEKGLMYGNMLATAKAYNGWYGTKETVEEILKFPLSPKGMEHERTIRESEYAGKVVLVPSKYMDKPRYTIGLGDSFVGGVQLCF